MISRERISDTRGEQINRALSRFGHIVEKKGGAYSITDHGSRRVQHGLAKQLSRKYDGHELVQRTREFDGFSRAIEARLTHKLEHHIGRLTTERRIIEDARVAQEFADKRGFTTLFEKLGAYVGELNAPISASHSPNRDRHREEREKRSNLR